MTGEKIERALAVACVNGIAACIVIAALAVIVLVTQ